MDEKVYSIAVGFDHEGPTIKAHWIAKYGMGLNSELERIIELPKGASLTAIMNAIKDSIADNINEIDGVA